MPRYRREISKLGIYHVMQRGVGKQIIFEDKQDHRFYLDRLKEYRTFANCDILAYCIMDNHAHILVKSESLNNLSEMMRKLGTSYANYYNQKYEHSGHVFQGRFLSEAVNDESYLFACVRYIHNNPVKAGITSRDRYPWSSYREYIGDTILINTGILLPLIGDVQNFESFSAQADDIMVLDFEGYGLTEADAINIINRELGTGCCSANIVKTLNKPERDKILVILKDLGMSVRTIERITGVNKNIIYRAGKSFS